MPFLEKKVSFRTNQSQFLGQQILWELIMQSESFSQVSENAPIFPDVICFNLNGPVFRHIIRNKMNVILRNRSFKLLTKNPIVFVQSRKEQLNVHITCLKIDLRPKFEQILFDKFVRRLKIGQKVSIDKQSTD